MKNIFILTIVVVTLAGCSTPKVMLKNPKTGQIESCGGSATGSLVGGVVGYHIQKSNDTKCEADLLAHGFQRIDSSEGTIEPAAGAKKQEPVIQKNFGSNE